MDKKLVSIVDYNVGNLTSIFNAVRRCGYLCKITNKKYDFEKSDLLILPGVGTFYKAMNSLYKLNLINFLKDYAREGRPVLGICLGMQLMADYSNEIFKCEGLGIIPGKIIPIEKPKCHIGWNSINAHKRSCLREFNNTELYFNHSFSYKCDYEYVHATSFVNYEMEKIAACIKKDKTVGLQFHPEKSQQVGKFLLENLFNHLMD